MGDVNLNNKIYRNSNTNSQNDAEIERNESQNDGTRNNRREKPKKKVTFFSVLFKIIFSILGLIISTVVTISLVLYFKYNVNVVETGKQLLILNQKVDNNSKYNNKFSSNDFNTYESKTSNFDSDFDAVIFSDKEIAAFINNSIETTKTNNSESDSLIESGEQTFDLVKNLDLKLIQIDLFNTYNIENTQHLTDMNFVFKLDLNKLKQQYLAGKFYEKIGDIIPDELYVSGIVEIIKDDSVGAEFDYKVLFKNLELNNLGSEKSKMFVDAINNFIKIGSGEDFTKLFGETFANAMIGNDETAGLYTTLAEYGAKGYSFFTDENVDYLVIYSHETTDVATISYENLKSAENINITSYTVLENKIKFQDIQANGYNFLGFYNTPSGDDERISTINAWELENKTLYARWTPIVYNIEYYMRGGIAEVENPTSYTIESEIILNDLYKNEATPFLGWTGTISDIPTKSFKINSGNFGDLIFYASFDDDERTLFLYADNKKIVDMTIIIGMPIDQTEINNAFDVEELGLNGYSAENWYIDSALQNEYNFSSLVENDVCLYTELDYIVKELTFYPFISRFESAVESGNLKLYSHEELVAYAEYIYFYNITTEVKIELSYIDQLSKVNPEFSSCINEVREVNSFNVVSSFQYSSFKLNNKFYLRCNISNSIWEEMASKVASEGQEKILKTINYAMQFDKTSNRSENFDDFKINNVSKALSVTNSSQLVYCLEQGYRPICGTGSKAELVYEKAKVVLREICDDEMTDFEKLRAIYEWLIYNVNYDEIAYDLASTISTNELKKYDSWYVEGVFNKGVAVCEGYAKAFLMLSKMEGIPAIFVSGNSHAWNRVFINNNWYGIDSTHGDVIMSEKEVLSYSQFLFTDSYKSSLGYTSSDYEYLTANTQYSYFEEINYSYLGNDFDLAAENSAEVSIIANYVKNYITENGWTTFTFDFIVKSNVSESSVLNSIRNKFILGSVSYYDSPLNSNYNHFIIMIQ